MPSHSLSLGSQQGQADHRLKSVNADEHPIVRITGHSQIPGKNRLQKIRQILLPHNASRSDARPEQLERRARLVSGNRAGSPVAG